MSDDSSVFYEESKREPVLRVVVLGAVYALAVLCAVVFSPSMGLVTPNPTGEGDRVASMEEPARR